MNNKKFNKLDNIQNGKMLDLYSLLNTKEFFELAKEMNIKNVKIQKEGDLLKFRMWKVNWPLPKEIKIKNDIIKYGASRRHQDIIKRVLYAKIEKFEEFRKRWSNRNKPARFWGDPHSIPYYGEDGWLWIKLHDNWIFNKIIHTFEDFIYADKWLYYRIPPDHIGISYISGEGHTHFILIPSSIKIDNFFFEGLGLQQGDGTHSLSDVHVTFTNGCYELIEHQLTWFKSIGIDLNSIRIYPEIPDGSEEEFNIMKEKLIYKGIEAYQFRKRKSKLSNTKHVLIQLVFHNKLFKLFYLHLLNNLGGIILENKERIIGYLRGILASEGSVKSRKECGLLSAIKISASPEKTRDFYKKCLINIGIISSKDELTKGSEAVMITRSENYKKILGMNLLSLHPKKQERFINILKNYRNCGGIKNE